MLCLGTWSHGVTPGITCEVLALEPETATRLVSELPGQDGSIYEDLQGRAQSSLMKKHDFNYFVCVCVCRKRKTHTYK